MTGADKRRIARVIVPGLIAGGAIGAGVGLGLYPAVVGIVGAVGVAAAVGLVVYRLRASRLRRQGDGGTVPEDSMPVAEDGS